MKKRMMALMLVLVMLVCVTGCSKGSNQQGNADTKQNESNVTVNNQEDKANTTENNEAVKNDTENAPADNQNNEEVKTPETRKFTDSLGREVEIPYEVKKVAISGPLTQIVFYGFAPEMLVGWSSEWGEAAKDYIPEEYLSLPSLGQLYGGKGELNLETLLAVAPDVIVDIGEQKKNMTEDLDALQAQVGIPFVHIDANIDTMKQAFDMLGELTGLEARAAEYGSYCDAVYSKVTEIIAQVGDNKVKALYCLGDAGCNVIAKGSYMASVIDAVTDNLAVVDNPSSKGSGNEVDFEQILNWNPEFIIFAAGSVYDSVGTDENWQQLDAIKNGNYVETPALPYNWMGFPPSVQRCLGMLWTLSILYPDKVDFDLKAEVVKYYELFYHIELTDDKYDELTKNAFVR